MSTARRRIPLPQGWTSHIVPAVLERDAYICKWHEDDHDGILTVDHIGDPSDHSMSNLRTLCQRHHDRRTQWQAAQAQGRTVKVKRKTQHPGLIS